MAKRDPSSFRRLAVVTGDHKIADPTKHGAAYGPQDFDTHDAMVAALESLGRFEVAVLSDHKVLFENLLAERPDLVVNFCDTGVGNVPTRELNFPAWLELQEIPYTGAPPQAMVITLDKHLVRLAARTLGAEVPREAGCCGAPPAAVNAVLDALKDFGVTHIDMPLTPEKVWRAIREAGK